MQQETIPHIQQWKTKKSCGIFSKLTMKTPEERQCFFISPCQWGCFGGCSCTWISFNIYLSIIYFISYMARYTTRQTRVPPNVTRSTELREAQRYPELAFRGKDFHVPAKLIFPALLHDWYKIKDVWYNADVLIFPVYSEIMRFFWVVQIISCILLQ